MQPNAELLKYIEEQTGQGWSIDQILPELHTFGWPDEEIRAALDWFTNQSNNAAPATLPGPNAVQASPTIQSPTEYEAQLSYIQETPQNPSQVPPVTELPQSTLVAPTVGPQYPPTVEAVVAAQQVQTQPPIPNAQIQYPESAPIAAPMSTPAIPLPNSKTAEYMQPVLVQPTMAPNVPVPNIATPQQQGYMLPVTQPEAPQTVAPPAQTALNVADSQKLQAIMPGAGRISLISRFKRQLSIIFVTLALCVAALLVWSVFNESPQSSFKNTVQKSLLTSTYQRDYTATLDEGLQVDAVIKSDFSDTTHPKSTATIEAVLEFGPESTITANYDLVAVDDTIWLRPTSISTNLDDATRTTYQDLSQGGDVDSVVSSLVGAGTLNQWEEFVYNPSFVTSYGLTYSMVRFGYAMNSPLSGFPVANANKHNNTAVNLVIGSGMIAVDYNKIETENIDSKKYRVYNATFNAKSFAQTARNLAELLDLSQRHRDAISEKDITVEDGEFKLWVDPKTHLPYQLKAPRDGVEIIYSNYGNNFDIKSPL